MYVMYDINLYMCKYMHINKYIYMYLHMYTYM